MSHYPRRAFLRQASLLGAAFSILPAGILRAASQIRIGVIGTGTWGRQYMSLAAAHPDVSIRGIYEPHTANRAAALSLCTLPPEIFSHWRQLVQSNTIDAVLIAAPHQWHGVMALEALKAGKHVLCGPVAASTPQGHDALVQASLRSGKQYITLNEADFAPDHIAVCNMVREGVFGDVQRVHTGVHCAQLPGDVYALQGAGSVLSMLGINAENPFTAMRLRREKMEYLYKTKDRKDRDITLVRRGELPVAEVLTARGQSLVLQLPQRGNAGAAIGFRLEGSAGRWLESARALQRKDVLPNHQWEAGKSFLEQYGDEMAPAPAAALHQAIALLRQGRQAPPTVHAAVALSRLQSVARQARKQGLTAVSLQALTTV